MLRPANDALKAHKIETATRIAVLSLALLFPCLAALSGVFFSDAATTYLRAYRPIIYLTVQADHDQATQLTAELEEWTTVAEAKLRDPQQAFELLKKRLGEQEVTRLGITAKMLPFSVVLVPTVPVAGHLDLIVRVSGLPARPEVAAVDVPSAQAARTLIFARWLLILGIACLPIFLIVGVAQTRFFLMRLADAQSQENTLLARFGAPPARLRRTTLWRGLTVGLWAGTVSFGALLMLLFLWQYARPAMLGLVEGNLGWGWVFLVAPLILGPAAGLLAAGLVNRSRSQQKNIDDLELQILL